MSSTNGGPPAALPSDIPVQPVPMAVTMTYMTIVDDQRNIVAGVMLRFSNQTGVNSYFLPNANLEQFVNSLRATSSNISLPGHQ
jgi:hypothetical protein